MTLHKILGAQPMKLARPDIVTVNNDLGETIFRITADGEALGDMVTATEAGQRFADAVLDRMKHQNVFIN